MSLPGQSVAVTHDTHAPAPSHIEPPFSAQTSPAASGSCEGTPATHRSSVHASSSSGRSVSSARLAVPPSPSHTTSWQSPAVCSGTAVPSGVKATPHTPAVQVLIEHAVSSPGQSEACTHCTHAPAPSHIVPSPSLQASPAARDSCETTPSVQTPVVHAFMSSGRSESSASVVAAPAPSQTARRQSPATWSGSAVPASAYWNPQVPLVQVRVAQAPSSPGHSLAMAQSTQTPPSHTPL